MTARRLVLACALLALVAAPAGADVRLVRSPYGWYVDLRVTVTSAGTWTPRGPVDDTVLNPGGDFAGDGAPAVGYSFSGSRLAAWLSPSTESLKLARATTTWSTPEVVVAAGAIGTPIVVRATQSWVVATRRSDGHVAVVGLTDEPGVVSGFLDLGSGILVGGRRASGLAQFILLQPGGCYEVIGIEVLVPDPQPIEVYRRITCDREGPPRRPPGFPGDSGDGSSPPPPGGGCGSWMSADPSQGRGPSVGEPSGSAPTLSDVQWSDGSVTGVLSWSTRAGVVRFLEIDDDGPVGDVATVVGGDASDPAALLDAASLARRSRR